MFFNTLLNFFSVVNLTKFMSGKGFRRCLFSKQLGNNTNLGTPNYYVYF